MTEHKNMMPWYLVEDESGAIVVSQYQEIDSMIAGPFETLKQAEQALNARRWRPLAWGIYIAGAALLIVTIL